jgi:PAS domain S-box-containing protein
MLNDTALTNAPLDETLQEVGVFYASLLARIIERKQAEEALVRSERRFRIAADSARELIWEWEIGADTIEWSDRIDDLLGYPPGGFPRTTEAWERILHPEDYDRVMDAVDQALASGQPIETSYRVVRRDGAVCHWTSRATILRDERGVPQKWVGVNADVTEQREAEEERRRLEDQIRHAHKFESLAILAGGIAHDFGNLLVGVLGNAALARAQLPVGSRARRYVEQIEVAATRAGDLSKQMLAYSGKGSFVVQPLDLSELVGEMAELLASSVAKGAVLEQRLAPGLPPIEGDATELRQVVMNLILNASDALGEGQGTIGVATGTTEADRAYLAAAYLNDDLLPGRYVYLEVADNGCGMDEATRARIFDPFFTTKDVGRGLGLAAVLGIVRGHRGAIAVHSRPGEGTTFRVLFPPAKAAPPTGAPAVTAGPAVGRRATGTVLVADDEALVRSVVKAAFQDAGFEVLSAGDGAQAVEVFCQHADTIVAVVLDVTMPRMSGEEALHEIRRVRPAVPVIMSSGYSEHQALGRLGDSQQVAFIRKPYDPADLVALVARLVTE